MAEIEFLSNGTFRVTYEDGTNEQGKFSLKDGGIVLVNAGGVEIAVTKNADIGKYDLVFLSSVDPEKTYEFEIEEQDVQTLKNNRT